MRRSFRFPVGPGNEKDTRICADSKTSRSSFQLFHSSFASTHIHPSHRGHWVAAVGSGGVGVKVGLHPSLSQLVARETNNNSHSRLRTISSCLQKKPHRKKCKTPHREASVGVLVVSRTALTAGATAVPARCGAHKEKCFVLCVFSRTFARFDFVFL